MEKMYTSVRLEVTSGCNLNCQYCHNAKRARHSEDMTTEEILRLIHSLKRKYNINKILLTGGEPLIKPDICSIVKEITALGIKADMVTNGTMLTLELLKELEKAGLKRIRLSIDEIDDESNVREGSTPSKLWEVAKMVVDNSNIELCIHTVCTNHNAKSLFRTYEKVLEVGAARWRVFDIGYQGGVVENKESFDFMSYYNDYIQSAKQIISHYIKNDIKNICDIEINNVFRTAFLESQPIDPRKVNVKDETKRFMSLSPCEYVTGHQISIRSSGEATLCQYFDNCIYDYKKYNYDATEAAKNKNNVAENEITVSDLSYCKNCKYLLLCSSGCRSRAKFFTGDIKDADPVACFLHPMVYEEIIKMLPKHVVDCYESNVNKDGWLPKYKEGDLSKFLQKRGY